MLVLLVVLATYATLYTVAAYDLARWGWTCRGTLGDATFLPFPTGPRGVLMEVLAKMSPVDEFIYIYLIKTGILIGVSILLWILAAAYFLKAVLPLFWKPSSRPRINLLDLRAHFSYVYVSILDFLRRFLRFCCFRLSFFFLVFFFFKV